MANNTIEADVRSLIGAIETLTNRVTDLEGKVKQTNTTGRQAKTVTDKLAEAQKKLNDLNTADGKLLLSTRIKLQEKTKAARQAIKGVKDLDKETKKYTRTLSNSEKVMNQFRGMMLQTFGAYAIIRGIRNTINTIKDFENDMSAVRAITGATAEEMKILSQIAKDVALNGGIFDPSTVAKLQIELSKLGFTASEIGFAVEPIVNLATATGEDLAKSAEIAAATLRSFQLDASEMTDVIDVMAKSFTTSALDMSRWAEGAKYAAPVANSLGWSVRDLASVMSVLANRQIFGSLAGTSLRNIMSELANSSSELRKRLGMTGTSFDEFIIKLQEAKQSGLDFNEILELVPRRASTAFLVLSESTDEVARMSDTMDKAGGSVQEMADIRLETLSAKLSKLEASWKAFIVTLEEGDGAISNFFKDGLDLINFLINATTLTEKYNLKWEDARFLQAELNEYRREATKYIKENAEESKKGADDYIESLDKQIVREKIIQGYKDNILGFIGDQIRQEKQLNNLIKTRDDLLKQIKEYESDGVSQYVIDESKDRLSELNYIIAENIELGTKAYEKSFNTLFSSLGKNVSSLTEDELIDLSKEVETLFKKYEKDLKNFEAAEMSGVLDKFSDEEKKNFEEIKLNTEELYRFYEEFGKKLNSILSKRSDDAQKNQEEADAAARKNAKQLLALEYQRRKNQIELNKDLTEQQREEELASLKYWYQTELYQLEIKYEEELAIREAYQKLLAQQEGLKNEELTDINNKYFDESIEAWTKYYEQKYANDKKYESLEIKRLDQEIKQTKKIIARSYKEKVAKAEALAQLEYDKAITRNKQAVQLQEGLMKDLQDVISQTDEETNPELIQMLELKIAELERTIAALKKTGSEIEKAEVDIKPKGLQDLLNIKNEDWGLLTQVLGEVSSAFSGMADAAVEAANRAVEASSRMVDQLQRDLEIEIALAEEGFASNVSLKRKELEEQKAIQQKALKDQEKAIKQQIALQATLDAANATASVINILTRETASKGLLGIAAAVVGAAAVFALISKVRTQSKAATKYEKGGWEVLKGKRHASGGISIGDNREAEDGELLAVFNRKATRKHGKSLTSFIDAVNKDKIHIDTKNVLDASKGSEKASVINVNYDSKETNRLLKQIRDNQDYIQGGYRIIKQGNRIRKVKINAV